MRRRTKPSNDKAAGMQPVFLVFAVPLRIERLWSLSTQVVRLMRLGISELQTDGMGPRNSPIFITRAAIVLKCRSRAPTMATKERR